MSHIFLSHVERDLAIMEQIARELEAAGYKTWYFERDVLAGTSYLIQITNALESCDAIVLIASPNACRSDQVTKEVVGAFERGKPFFPVLINMTPPELKESQPEWRHALGGTAMIMVKPEDLSTAAERIINGLKIKGISPDSTVSTASHPISPRAPVPPSSTEGERKNVTVMFADAGFTAMSEEMDPEAVTDMMNECFRDMGECIEQHGGTIDKFIGDSVMALFGSPKTLEDAPHRAIETALEMRNTLLKFNEDKHLPLPLIFHIGINTGPVIAGMVGSGSKQEFTVMGDTVNLASRMEDAADTGSILVAENTYHLTEGYFYFEPIGEVKVKGSRLPVKAYKVIGPRRTITRIEACQEKGLSPFVGRTLELDILDSCLAKVKAGHGQVVGVVGEPGVGKSRLVSKFRESLLPAGEYTVIEGGCVHYGDTIPYLPILDMLRDYFDIRENENESGAKQKITDKITSLSGQLSHVLTPLHEILSLKIDDEDYVKLDAKQRHDRVFEAIRLLLIAESQASPLVIIIEDLHWMDRTSEEFLSFFINSLATTRILLILLFRSEYNPGWSTKTYYSQIRVDQLARSTMEDLVRGILRCSSIEPELIEFIADRTEGNPLFIEEMTYNLQENGSIKKENERYLLSPKISDMQVPATIQGIIAARLDRLEETHKAIMQTASVIGREFGFRILQEVATLKHDLKTSLAALQDLEFIYEKSLFPELEYIFKHALTQEVTYNSLLHKNRRETHEKVGQAIELIYADRLEEFYEMLAYHYSLSNDSQKAYRYYKLSGDKASKNYSNWEAVRFCKEALRVLDSWPDNDDTRKEKIQLLLLLQIPLFLLGYPKGSLENLLQAETLAQELGDQRALASFHRSLSLYHTFKEDLSLGVEYGEKCFHGALAIDEVDLITQSADQLCFAYFMQGDALKSVKVSQRSLELFETHRLEKDLTTGGLNVYSSLCVWNGTALNFLGRFEEAATMLEKGIRNARELNDWWEIGNGEFHYSTLLFFRGDGDGTIAHARESLLSFERAEIGIMRGLSCSMLGLGYYLRGEYETARTHAEKGLSIQKELGMNRITSYCSWFLSLILWAAGDLAHAREHAEETLKAAKERKQKNIEGMASMVLGGITGKFEPTNIDEALQDIQRGIMVCEELRLKPLTAMGYLFLGELSAEAGRREEALESLKKAERLYLEMEVTPESCWLKRTQEALAKLEQ